MIRNQADLDALIDTLSRFVRERLVPNEDLVDQEGVIPEELVEEMRQLGLAGLSLPERYGGSGITSEEKALAYFTLGWTSPAFYRRFGSNDSPGFGLLHAGTEEQKSYWLPRLAAGEITGSFALTEPEAGSDAGSLRTTARREGNEYVINGGKRYITNAPLSDVFLVMARTDPEEPGPRGVTSILVPGDTPGLIRGRPDRKMGLAGNDTGDLTFENCRVPVSNRIGAEGQGFKIAMQRLDHVRIEAAAIAVGNAERLIEESITYARDRRQFGEPIANFQLIQAMLADSKAEAYAARTMVLDTARKVDAGEQVSTEAACCKLFATEMVGKVADRAVQIHGGSGFMRGTAAERFYRDVRIYRIFDGTNQIQQMIIARNLLRDAG